MTQFIDGDIRIGEIVVLQKFKYRLPGEFEVQRGDLREFSDRAKS
jgi:hypothetical protein